jgi:uncharacterized membrane protein YeaQ/YmgE (transglycosylase-associated protein family)
MMLLITLIKQSYDYTSVLNDISQHPILVWLISGLISGFIASLIVNSHGIGVIRDILLGIVGAVIGGWIFNYFGWGKVTGLNLMSLLIGVVGGVVFLVVYHLIFRRPRRATYY